MHYATLGDIVAAKSALEKVFSAAPDDIDFTFELAELQRELDDRRDAFNEAQSKYANKYGVPSPDGRGFMFVKKDEDGEPVKDKEDNYVIDPEAVVAFNEKMDALAAKEVEFSRKLTRDEIRMIRADVELTAADLRSLLWLIAEHEQKEEPPDE
jgi:hypothetical protein